MIVIESLDLSTLSLAEIGSGNLELCTGEELDGDLMYISFLDRETYEKKLMEAIGSNPLEFRKMPLIEVGFYLDKDNPNIRNHVYLMSCTEAMARQRIKDLSTKEDLRKVRTELRQSVAS